MSDLWAITCFYDPVGSPSRLANFHRFRSELTVPLIAVELSFDGVFSLDPGDAEIVLHRSGGDVMWQKERLLNLAFQGLPDECDYVVWLDADVLFADPRWASRVRQALQRHVVVTPASRIVHLPPDGGAGEPPLFVQTTLAAWWAGGHSIDFDTIRRDATGPAGGFAGAYRREVIEASGFYDACIIGGGDTAVFSAAIGRPERTERLHRMNPAQSAWYRDWAGPFQRAVAGRVGFVEGDLVHLWHGPMEARRANERHVGLEPFAFDPAEDIAVGDGGCWVWSSDKPGLHAYLAEYFASRAAADQPARRTAVG